MFVRNLEVRAAKGNIPKWVIAERLSIHENTLHLWMRKELPEAKKLKILRIIEEIKSEMEGE